MGRVWDNGLRKWVKNTLPLPRFRIHVIPGYTDLLPGLLVRAQRLLPREKEIIVHRLGVDSIKSITLPELGLRYGVSRHRVAQIEKSACKKLGVILHRPPSQNYITHISVSRNGDDKNVFEVPDLDTGKRFIFMAIHGDMTLDNGAYI